MHEDCYSLHHAHIVQEQTMPTQTIFITGTNSGFGKAAVERFAQAG